MNYRHQMITLETTQPSNWEWLEAVVAPRSLSHAERTDIFVMERPASGHNVSTTTHPFSQLQIHRVQSAKISRILCIGLNQEDRRQTPDQLW